MIELSNILEQASLKISENYFCLNRFESPTVLRERHYCYELYHQMRCIWPSHNEYILSGEIDKASHYYIKDLVGSFPIPDLLIHIPGTMNNEAIIEVKTTKLERNGIEKDITNLSIFLEKAEYKRAIFLIFGEDFSDKKLEKIKSIYSQMSNNGINVQPIEIWLHDQFGNSARKIHTLEIAS
ncbi:methionyl-tRNA formyltransferase-like protein [Klebsiella pneumoniae]|uniref:methionyl-tRNA formyltransferase-like protein n=1 Tax=Klebsiella pneumoniae TaxID=573 RepID=UPI000BD8BA04|nr:methionyl-tRNA formyltransferase-like protein [Klebsiella pneumoniae]MCI8228347.1 hypothetical protein [Klebsiella pneumoniae]MDM8694184.1 hypothetical protein [Klebsiella pneumoniae]MDS0504146.1 hypothetical protein [Klebsiella pneumoniae]PCN37235.1 methionyl-tRNA formyltransferase-like protein [Klebsiella pneumoniae]TAI22229.1 methionyl-tRNA formyltransferase-like protein [Klebsiella pneumoniae]